MKYFLDTIKLMILYPWSLRKKIVFGYIGGTMLILHLLSANVESLTKRQKLSCGNEPGLTGEEIVTTAEHVTEDRKAIKWSKLEPAKEHLLWRINVKVNIPDELTLFADKQKIKQVIIDS